MQYFKDLHTKAQYDIAIIGAGIAGLYTAYRLLEHKPKLKIAIFERLNRTGGRLDSDIIKLTNNGKLVKGKKKQNVNTIKEEQGGMRFNDSMEDSKTRDYLSKPYKDKGLYLCNEAISDMQAWVNGSLRSADLALAHFKIKPLPGEKKVATRGGEAAPVVRRKQGFGGVWGVGLYRLPGSWFPLKEIGVPLIVLPQFMIF
jgi:hypothetical protein